MGLFNFFFTFVVNFCSLKNLWHNVEDNITLMIKIGFGFLIRSQHFQQNIESARITRNSDLNKCVVGYFYSVRTRHIIIALLTIVSF